MVRVHDVDSNQYDVAVRIDATGLQNDRDGAAVTCIAGCIDTKGRIWLAGDSSVNGANTLERTTDPKVWRSGGVLFGVAGNWAAADLLRRIDCPVAPSEQWIRYGITSKFRQLRTEIGVPEPDAKGDGFEVLIGALGALWWASDELAGVRMGRYAAVGSGCEFALGVLCDRETKLSRLALLRALEAAARHCPSVEGPFTEVSL